MALQVYNFQTETQRFAWVNARAVSTEIPQVWVSNRLEEKRYLQEQFLISRPRAIQQVFRTSEYWERVLKFLAPQLLVTSAEFLQTLLTAELEVSVEKRKLQIQSDNAKTLIDAVTQFLPLILFFEESNTKPDRFAENHEYIDTWAEVPEFAIWKQWYMDAAEVWNFFKEKQLIHPQWITGVIFESLLKKETELNGELVRILGKNTVFTDSSQLDYIEKRIVKTVFELEE